MSLSARSIGLTSVVDPCWHRASTLAVRGTIHRPQMHRRRTITYPEWLPEPLQPVVARLARVDDCIAEMADLAGAWSLRALELKQLRRRDMRFRTVVSAVRPIPPVISMLFSESIGHLRSILDNVVWHLVTEEMGTLDDRVARSVAMPIYEDPEKFAGWARRLRSQIPPLGLDERPTHQRIRALQPFADSSLVPSVSPVLAAMMGVEVEEVPPLMLLQAYSNADKHRAIALMVGRTVFTKTGEPYLRQDRAFREIGVGARVGADGTWGTPTPIESHAAVMVERPAPWSAAVSPAMETTYLRDWVRNRALPWLVTGAEQVEVELPVTIDLDDTGQSLRTRIESLDRPSGQERTAELHARRFAEASARPWQFPEVVDEEFDD